MYEGLDCDTLHSMRTITMVIAFSVLGFVGGYAVAWYIGDVDEQPTFNGTAIRETEAEAEAYLASLPEGCVGNWHAIDHGKAYYVSFTCPRD